MGRQHQWLPAFSVLIDSSQIITVVNELLLAQIIPLERGCGVVPESPADWRVAGRRVEVKCSTMAKKGRMVGETSSNIQDSNSLQ